MDDQSIPLLGMSWPTDLKGATIHSIGLVRNGLGKNLAITFSPASGPIAFSRILLSFDDRNMWIAGRVNAPHSSNPKAVLVHSTEHNIGDVVGVDLDGNPQICGSN